MQGPGTAAERRPLLVTASRELTQEVLRLAATTGVEVDVAGDVDGARRRWSRAPLVVVGADVVELCAAAGLARRDGVVLVGHDLDDAGIWQRAVAVGAAHVVFLPDAQEWLCHQFADAHEGPAAAGRVVATVGGRGGAGATTLAAALAVTGARSGRQVLLVDGDPLGGGIDLVFGGEGRSGVRWPELGATRGRLPSTTLTSVLPRLQDLSVLSWDRGDALAVPVAAMTSVLAAGRRAHDLVVVDLPRAHDDCSRHVLGLADLVLLVVPAEVRAAAAASRVAASVALHARDVRLVVREPAPGGLTAQRMALSLGLPLAGFLRREPGLEAALDRGEAPASHGRGPLAGFCEALLGDLVPGSGAAS